MQISGAALAFMMVHQPEEPCLDYTQNTLATQNERLQQTEAAIQPADQQHPCNSSFSHACHLLLYTLLQGCLQDTPTLHTVAHHTQL
jgi:hypothetical protein